MRIVLVEVERIWNKYEEEAVITAGNEVFEGLSFIHSLGSLHPFGQALDFRTRYFDKETVKAIAFELRNVLGRDYDIVIHDSHVHIEYDPK